MKGKHAKNTANKQKLAKRMLALCFAVVFLCSCVLPVFASGSSLLTDALREAVEETAASTDATTEAGGGTMMDSFQTMVSSYTTDKTTYRFWLSEKDSNDLPDAATTSASDLALYNDFYAVAAIENNTTLTAPEGFQNPADPTGAGRTFKGWYYIDTYGVTQTFTFDDSPVLLDKSATVDVFAKWGEAPAADPADDADKAEGDTKADDTVKDDETASDDETTTTAPSKAPAKAPAKSEAAETEVSFDDVEAVYAMDDADADISLAAIGQDSEKTVSVGAAIGLTSSKSGYYFYNHKWSSSDATVATVYDSGSYYTTVTGLKAGFVTITHTWTEKYYSYGRWYTRDGSETATVTVTDEAKLYCYTLIPGKKLEDITDTSNPNNIWNGMGVSKISGLGSPSSHDIGSILDTGYGSSGATITYPTSYPDITVDGTAYHYASDDSENRYKEGFYTIKWIRVVVSNGANAGNNNYNSIVAAGTNTYHLDGQITLNQKDIYGVTFELKDAGKTYFSVVEEEKYSKRVSSGTKASTLDVPTTKDPGTYPAEKYSGGLWYKFDGWYTDEGCTEKVDFDTYVIYANTTFYGRYIPKDTVEQDTPYITVEKRFKGITKDQIPNGFFIQIGGWSFPVNNAAYVEDLTTDDLVYRWKRNVSEGSYNITEHNTEIDGYDLTTTINGEPVTTTSSTVNVRAKEITVNTNGYVETKNSNPTFNFGVIGDENYIFAVAVVGSNKRNVIVSKEPLSVSQRESVAQKLNNLGGDGSTFANNRSNEFYSLNDQTEIIIAEGKITYDSTAKTVTISAPSVWNKVVSLKYDVTEGNNPEVTITNRYTKSTADFTIKKLVTGNLGDLTRKFNFTITVKDKNNTDASFVLNNETKSGTASFELGNNESISLTKVPVGATVTITETDAEDYTVSATLGGTEITSEPAGTSTFKFTVTQAEASGTTSDDVSEQALMLASYDEDLEVDPTATGTEVVITNYKNLDEVPTGVILDTLPYVLMLIAVGGGVVAFFLRKRHHDDEE